MTYWTETAIAQHLDGKFYQVQHRCGSGVAVIDLNYVEKETPVAPAKAVPKPEPVKHRPDGYLWLEDIARVTCNVYGITRADFMSIRRSRKMVEARQVFYWLAKRYTAHSFPMIGAWCGKDHSTVLHGVEKIDTNYERFLPTLEKCVEKLGVSLEVKVAA